MESISEWATIDPEQLSVSNPYRVSNLVGGTWRSGSVSIRLEDPLNGGVFAEVSNTSQAESAAFLDSCSSVSKSGLHNPFKSPERYLLYGRVCSRAASLLNDPGVFSFFSRLIQRFVPKHSVQSDGEMQIIKTFIENFAGDNVRFLARGFTVPGDHLGQRSQGFRFPYGPVALITPFNFPLEIPVLQMMGALFMGNKVVVKPDVRAAACIEQWVRFLHYCGLPLTDLDILNGDGSAMEFLIRQNVFRMTLFTGSSAIAAKLTEATGGRIKVEDSGYDWKVLGPDVSDLPFVAYTSDQDAYAFGGQKCSAQSILFAHKNWVNAGFFDRVKELAERRSLEDLTIVPILSWNNERIQAHVDAVLTIPGSYLLFGGKEVTGHNIPKEYGAYLPTAVFVPVKEILPNLALVSRELFGPFQIVTEWEDLEDVLLVLESLSNHLTAAVVSKDTAFIQEVLGRTVNGTTYVGIRARTTGAPQNHWFGPSADPRAGGIGTREAIQLMWSAHREIIEDLGPVPSSWSTPGPS